MTGPLSLAVSSALSGFPPSFLPVASRLGEENCPLPPQRGDSLVTPVPGERGYQVVAQSSALFRPLQNGLPV